MIVSFRVRPRCERKGAWLATRWAIVAVGAALFFGCDDPVIVYPEKNQTPPLPAHRLYVAKSFSVVTESGVSGFPVGKEVTLIREENGKFLISDGSQLARAPKSSFTRDIEVVNQARQKSMEARTPAAQAQEQTSDFHRLRTEENARLIGEQPKGVTEQKRQRLRAELAAVEKRISAAEAEIATKQGNQRPVRRTYNAYGVLKIYQGKSAYTLSADASEAGMKDLIRRRDRLTAELGALR